MGAKQAKLKAETVDELTRSTPFNEQEIQLWYRGFLKVTLGFLLSVYLVVNFG